MPLTTKDNNNTKLLPLEDYLMKLSAAAEGDVKRNFPYGNSGYFKVYQDAKSLFNEKYYKNMDICSHLDAKKGTVFTKHNIEHIEDVITNAGYLLGLDRPNVSATLNGFEAYLLLMAILVHDIGMYMGRDGHEKRCEGIIMSHCSELGIGLAEAKLISRIAAAHTGKDDDGNNRDTIAELPPRALTEDILHRDRALAALVRFADELSEHSKRAYNFVEKDPRVNDASKLRHAYCRSIVSLKPSISNQTILIEFSCSVEQATKKYKESENEYTTTALVEHIISALTKLEQEREYCTRYFAELAYISGLNVCIEIYYIGEYDLHETIIEISESIGESGYPGKKKIQEIFKAINPENILLRHSVLHTKQDQ